MSERVPTFEEFVAEKIRTGQFNPFGGTPPQSMMSNAQLQSRGPGYGSQAARVASAPVGPVSLPPADALLSAPVAQTPIIDPYSIIGAEEEFVPSPPMFGMASGLVANSALGLPRLEPRSVPQVDANGIPVITPENVYNEAIKAGYSPDEARKQAENAANPAFTPMPPPTGSGLLNTYIPFGEQTGPALEKADEAINYTKIKVYEQQAELIRSTILSGREEGLSDREIITRLKSPLNPFVGNIPIGPNDDDATITKFIDGFLDAYDHGFTSYKTEVTQVPVLGGMPSQVPVEAWGPGSRAAHEYMAGESGILEKVTGEIFLDPINAAGIERPLAQAGIKYGAKLMADESASFAVRKIAGPTLSAISQGALVPSWALNTVPDEILSMPIDGLKKIPILGKGLETWKGSVARRKGYEVVDAVRRGITGVDGRISEGPAAPTTTDALGNPIVPDSGGPIFEPSQTTLNPAGVPDQGPIPRTGFWGMNRTPGTYETDPVTGQVTFTPSGSLSDGPIFEPKVVDDAVDALPTEAVDEGPLPNPFAGKDPAFNIQPRPDVYTVNDVGQVVFDTDQLVAGIARRKDVIADIERRITEAADDVLDTANLEQELDVAMQDVAELERIADDIAEMGVETPPLIDAARPPDAVPSEPAYDTPEYWAAVNAGAIRQFDQVPGGPRLVDQLDDTDDLWIGIDRASTVNASYQSLIDELKAEADAITGFKANAYWDGPLFDDYGNEIPTIKELYREQELNALDHVVNDIVPEAVRQRGYSAVDAIPVTAKRAKVPTGEAKFRNPTSTTPGGNQIRMEIPDNAPDGFIADEIIIAGGNKTTASGGKSPQFRYIRKDADGTWSVRSTPKTDKGLKSGLTEAEAITLADQELAAFPRYALDKDEELGYLMQKAVLDQRDDRVALIFNELRNRIGRDGFTEAHYTRLENLRAQLKFNRTPPQSEEAAKAWATTRERAKAEYPPDMDKDPSIAEDGTAVNGGVNKLVRNAATEPGVNSLEQAIAKAEEIGQRRFKANARAYIDAAIRILREMFDESRKLYAVDPRLARFMQMPPPPKPKPPRDLTAQPLTMSSDRRLDDKTEALLDEVWDGPGGKFVGKNAREVAVEVRKVLERHKRHAQKLIDEGADPDRLTKAERREIIKSARQDPKKKKKTAQVPTYESQSRPSTGIETLDGIIDNEPGQLTPAGNKVHRKKGQGSGEYRIEGADKVSVDVTQSRGTGLFTVVKGRTALTDQVVVRGLTEQQAIAKADEILPPLQKKIMRDSWYNEPNPALTPDETVGWYLREWAPIGDLLKSDLDELVASKVGFERALNLDPKMHDQRNLFADMLHLLTLRLPRTLLLADPATSWTYTQRNIISNIMLAELNDPMWIFKADTWRAIRQTYSDDSIDNSVLAEMIETVRGGKISEELRITIDKSEFDTGTAGTRVARLMDSTPGLDVTRRGLSAVFDWKRNIDRGIERAMKISTFAPEYRAKLGEATHTLAQEMTEYAGRRDINITASEIVDTLWTARDKNGVFGRDDVYDALYYHLLDGGNTQLAARNFAETASRRWTNLVKEAEERALKRVNKIFPSSLDETTIDHYARYVLLFHFWPTRSTKYVVEQMIRHPQIALSWYKAHEGMERMAEEGGYPDIMRGYFRVMQGPFGFMLYANPAALFMVTMLLPETHDYSDREGTTGIGKFLNKIKETTGLAPLPIIDALLALHGIYGDENVPDILPSRTTDLVINTLNAILVNSGHDPMSPVWDQTMSNAQEFLSGMMPGVNTIQANDRGGGIQDPIGQMVLKQNPEMWARMTATEEYIGADGEVKTRPTADAAAAYNQFIAIMDNEESDEYIAAEKSVYGMSAIRGWINTVSPLTVRAVDEDRAFAMELSSSGYDALDEGLEPTTAEQGAMTTRAIVSDSKESRELKGQSATVRAYGTTRQVTLNDGYNQIAYQPIQPGTVMVIGNSIYTWEDVMTMSEDERRALADEWLVANNGLEEYASYREGKDALTATLPALSSYNEFTDFMRDGLEGGIPAARDFFYDASPGYRAYIDQLPADIRNDPAEFDEKSLSQDAFLAASGKSTSVYDKPYGDATDPAAIRADRLITGGDSSSGGSGGGSTDYESAASRLEKLNKSIAKYDTEMAAFDKKVMAITGGVAFDDLAPAWQTSLAKRLEREGVKVPSKPATVRNYDEWRDLQEASGLPSDKMTYIEWTLEEAANLAEEAAA